MMLAVRLERWLFAVSVAAVAALCLCFRYLPLTDLPQHYAMVSVLVHHHDPAYGFADRFAFDFVGRPYASVYLLAAGLAKLLSLGAALRIVVALCTIAPLCGLYALLVATERPRVWSLLAVPFAFGSVWFWGFLNFLLGTGLFLLALALVVKAARTGSWRTSAGVGALALLVLVTHVHGLFMLLPLAPLYAWAHRGPGRAWLRPLAALAPAALALAVFVFSTWRQAVGSSPAMDLRFADRVDRFADFLAAGFPAPWPLVSVGVVAVIALGSVVLRDRSQPMPKWAAVVASAALAGQVLLYLVLPLNTTTVSYVSARHALLVLLFLLPLLPVPRFHLWFAFAGAALALATLVIAAATLSRFDREARDFDPILAVMKPNRRVAPLMFERSSPLLHPSAFPYVHFAAYYQAARGGDLARSFAVLWNVPVRYRADYRPHVLGEDVEWQPQRFSMRADLPHYDYLLVRDRGFVPETGLVLAAQSGPWLLFENPQALRE